MKKYHSIVRLGHRTTEDVLKEGDYIHIQEKLDGSNASFKRVGDTVYAYSRNKELNENNTLNGFYQWVQESIDPENIMEGLIYFGEWLAPHKIKYPDHTNQFFLYDIFHEEGEGQYVHPTIVHQEANSLGLNVVPTFYEGKYQSFEHLESFIGKTVLGGRLGDKELGEGIVVKNVNYRDRFGRQMFVKLVSEEFREVQKQKAPRDPNRPKSKEQMFVDTTVTKARIDKIVQKLVDENELNPLWGIEDLGKVIPQVGDKVFQDILAEERDMLPEEYDEKSLRKLTYRAVAIELKSTLTVTN